MIEEFVKSLKPGDKVIVKIGGFNSTKFVGKVIQKTPTGRVVVECSQGTKTFDKYGVHRIDSWHSDSIEPYTQKFEKARQRKIQIYRIKKILVFDKMTNLQLNRIETLLDEIKEENEG